MSTFPGFSPDALAFLRALKRNNRREWFQPRKEKYEALIKNPMLELINGINAEFAGFAPDYVRPARKVAFRIYRDTRFSHDKTPYKTHMGAIFPRSSADKFRGACFYFHWTDKELLAFGGVYSPERDELLAYRGLMLQHHEELAEILRNKALKRALGGMQGEQLTRMPKGFPEGHPADKLIRHRQWYLEANLNYKLVTTRKLLPELVHTFKLMAPFVEFLNRPFAQKPRPRKMDFLDF